MMRYKKLVRGVLAILLAASLLAFATDAISAPEISSHKPQASVQANPVPTWQQVNSSGFGDLHEQEVSALEAFNGYLYAGTFNVVDPLVLFDGARIFRSPDGLSWTAVTQPGFQNPHDSAPPAILDFVVFGNRLYASTGRGGNPAQIWRSSTGLSWAPMVTAGFGDPDIHDIAALAVYNGMIYAGASSQVSGARIFLSATGDSNSWNPLAPAAGTMAGAGVTGFAVFNNALWATIESEAPLQIWQSNGGPWTVVLNNGFGDSNTTSSGGMAEFGGYLYVGAGNAVSGAQLWRTNNGSSWAQAITPGFGDPNNQKVEAVYVFQAQLYVSLKNALTGIEVWRSADGALWEQVNLDGFGDSNNITSNRSSATADFLSQLYVGTSNVVAGGQIWRMLQPLPDTPTPTATNTATQPSPPPPTPTFTATNTPTVSPTNTLTDTPTPTPTDTATQPSPPPPTPTFTATNTPTVSPTNTPTNTPTPTYTPTSTSSPTPTSTTPPSSNTPGKVTGGGSFGLGGARGTFGFTVSYAEGGAAPKGNLTYQDHVGNLRFKAASFDSLVIDGNHASFEGMGKVNGGQAVRFRVEVSMLKRFGEADTFFIYLPALANYTAGGELTGGRITIHLR